LANPRDRIGERIFEMDAMENQAIAKLKTAKVTAVHEPDFFLAFFGPNFPSRSL
jgi:hypothetical protein